MPTAPSPQGAAISTAGAIAVVVGALYLGREILIPLALAILLSFIMTPPMLWLRRQGVPRIVAASLVVLVAFAGIAAVAVTVGMQIVQLADNLPSYERNIKNKLASLRASTPGAGLVERVTDTLRDLGKELSRPELPAGGDAGQANPRRDPVPVVLVPAPMQPLDMLRTVLGPLLGPLVTAALVALFVVLILLEREELRDRFIKLAGGGDLQRSTEAVTEAAARVSRYLSMQLAVNVTYGIPIGVGLWLIGVPNAVLWGVLAAVLRFIPYIGQWIAALCPVIIAFGVDPGWTMLIATIALFVVVELVLNNAIEPWLYGSSTGLSAFAIILAAIFWTLLWGPVGLVLATPLTVCMVVIGRYVPRLEFLGLILGSEPVLTPDERLYQRLLAGNVEEAVEMAEAETDGTSSLTFYEAVALPALRRAQNDRRRSADIELRRNIADSMIAVVREVEDHVGQGRDKVDPSGPTTRAAEAQARVLCIGGRTELDLAAAEIVAGRLSERGVRAVTAAPISVSASAIGQLDLTHAEVLCISYFHPRPWVYVRYVCRRIGRRAPRLPIIVCCWNLASDAGEPAEREPTLGANATLVITLEAAEQKIVDALSAEAAPPADASVRPHDRTRLETLRQLGLAVGKGPVFERLAASLSEELGTSATLVVPIDERTAPNGTVAASAQDKPDIPLSELICAEVVSARATVVVDDAAADRRFSSNAELLEKGIRSIVAAPLRSPTGDVLGALVAFDSDKRSFSDGDIRLLEAAAAELVSTLSDPPGERSSRRD